MKLSTFYCCVSSNKGTKSGEFASKVVRIHETSIPPNEYDARTETYYDYFGNRKQALRFAALLRRRNGKS